MFGFYGKDSFLLWQICVLKYKGILKSDKWFDCCCGRDWRLAHLIVYCSIFGKDFHMYNLNTIFV